ncbi:MAG: murein L,D-transpeptidase catalytic domain family protein [Chitinophagaceae bacterium]|nr:murein L,D-transpeptidase catalytic domain family protein [Chitinophagaceae bacterium]
MRMNYPTIKARVLSALILVSVMFISAVRPETKPVVAYAEDKNTITRSISPLLSLYDSLDLGTRNLSRDAFTKALMGFEDLRAAGSLQNPNILSIVDFSLASDKKRLFIIDVKKGKLLFHTYVAHGRNSGQESAMSFSNKLDSYKSSLGFFVTGNTYKGEHGYSLRLNGVENGINDNAFNRNIVVHGASYVSEQMIRLKGFIGRSLGCPAIPTKLHKPIIQTIKDGSCLFLYSPDQSYISKSSMLAAEADTAITAFPIVNAAG